MAQEEIENMNKSYNQNNNLRSFACFHQQKAPGPDGSKWEFYSFTKKKLKERKLINFFLKARIFVILNLDRIRNGNCTDISLKNID